MKIANTHKWILKAAGKDIPIIIVLTVLGIIISLCTIWFALISRTVVDIATDAAEGDMWRESTKLLGVLLLQAVLRIAQSRLNVLVLGKTEIRINQRLFSRIFSKKWQSISSYHSGDILTRMTSDVSVVVNALVTLIPRWVSMITRLIACIGVLLIVDVSFTLILLAVGLTVFVLSRFYGKKMKKIHRECQETQGKTRSFIQECIENWIVVKSFNAQDQAANQMFKLQNLNFKRKIHRNNLSNIASTAIFLLFSGSYFVALVWGAWRLASGMITFGALTAFLQIVQQIQLPFRNMSGMTPQYYNMLASAERLIELENLPQEACFNVPCVCVYQEIRGIAIKGMSFYYGNEQIFSHADVYLKKGDFIAVKGHSGIGKSTLLKMLLGFLEPSEGKIFLDTSQGDIEIGAHTRSLFSYVPQGNLILSGSIKQNIMFGCPDATDDQVWRAVETAGIADFIKELPKGIDTMLGERGMGLSEGQIQRLSIARGILCNAPILLLDEATSALDEKTEAEILNNLRAMSDKTCVFVSHRQATSSICDSIIELCDGKIIQK